MSIGTLLPQRQQDAELPLHEILALEEGRQAQALEQFMDTNDTVLLKTSGGSPMKIRLHGKDITISNRGFRCSPRLATQIIRGWGYRGKYWARERNTGMRQVDMAHLPNESKERMKWYLKDVDFDNLKPREDYIIHVPDAGILDELQQLEAEFAALAENEEAEEQGPALQK